MGRSMTDGYQQWGWTHLSASALSTYINEPALFLMERLLGFRGPTNAAMARGKAAEEGIHLGLMDPKVPVEQCIGRALSVYDTEMRFSGDAGREKERDNLAGYVENGLAELRQYGVPSGYQQKISIDLHGVSIPVIGYIDWEYAQHGLIVDLKTTERLPSSLSVAHARQGAIYAKAFGNFGMRFCYAKPKASKSDGRSCIVLELDRERAAQEIAALTNIAQRLERFLRISKDPHELLGLVCPNYESFYWNNPSTRAKGLETFGF